MAIQSKYRDIVTNAVRTAAAAGVPGSFIAGVDVTAISATWVTMTCAIAARSGHSMSASVATKFVSALLTGALAYWGGSKLFTTLLHVIPGAGTITAMGINAFLNGFYTYRLGKYLISRFDHAGFNEQDFLSSARSVIKFVTNIDSLADFGETIACVLEG